MLHEPRVAAHLLALAERKQLTLLEEMRHNPLIQEAEIKFHADVQALQDVVARNVHCQKLHLMPFSQDS